jgi:hypothetical protein
MEELLAQYGQGYALLLEAISGLDEEELTFKPAPDKWSIREVIIHVSDAEGALTHRMKKVISEENSLLIKFDPDSWADTMYYNTLDHRLFLESFKLLRQTMLLQLQTVEDAAWERTGVHNVFGKMTLLDIFKGAVKHVDNHLNQIARIKKAYQER